MTILCDGCNETVSRDAPDYIFDHEVKIYCLACCDDNDALKLKIEELKVQIEQLTTPKKVEPVIEESEFEDLIKESQKQECPPGLSAFHPLTCGKNRHDEAHVAYQKEHGGDFGELVVTSRGLLCPVPGCGYTQNWRIQ